MMMTMASINQMMGMVRHSAGHLLIAHALSLSHQTTNCQSVSWDLIDPADKWSQMPLAGVGTNGQYGKVGSYTPS